jgi:hypothetical protein
MHTQTLFLKQHLLQGEVPLTPTLDRVLASQLIAVNSLRLVEPQDRYFADLFSHEKGSIALLQPREREWARRRPPPFPHARNLRGVG